MNQCSFNTYEVCKFYNMNFNEEFKKKKITRQPDTVPQADIGKTIQEGQNPKMMTRMHANIFDRTGEVL